MNTMLRPCTALFRKAREFGAGWLCPPLRDTFKARSLAKERSKQEKTNRNTRRPPFAPYRRRWKIERLFADRFPAHTAVKGKQIKENCLFLRIDGTLKYAYNELNCGSQPTASRERIQHFNVEILYHGPTSGGLCAHEA